MEFLSTLWLPILVSAVFVFVVSSIIHMAVQYHKADYKRLSDEAGVLDGLRSAGLEPGNYMFPGCDSMKEMGSPEMIEKYNRGPVGFLTLFPNGPMAMGKSLIQWFIYSLLISVFVAYLTNLTQAPGSEFMAVFRVSGTIAVLAYATAHIPNSIWMGSSWGSTVRFVIDGILYGLATAAAFAWLWPGLA